MLFNFTKKRFFCALQSVIITFYWLFAWLTTQRDVYSAPLSDPKQEKSTFGLYLAYHPTYYSLFSLIFFSFYLSTDL